MEKISKEVSNFKEELENYEDDVDVSQEILEEKKEEIKKHTEVVYKEKALKQKLKSKLKHKEIKINGLSEKDLENPEKILNKVSKKTRLIRQNEKHKSNKKMRAEDKKIEKEFLN